ncbi:MAG: hypothetical protein E7049_00765 [Lentisphaerae bacterium]|nr:hypothetical protein [Lentisphaerota bacterium]
MNIEMSSGDYKIIASGFAMSVANNPLDIYLKDDAGAQLYHIRFRFISDNQNPNSVIRSNGIDNGAGVELLLVNFEHSLGRGIVTPMAIASRQGQDALFLTFTVNTYRGVEAKQVAFTIYTREVR